jgi:hypothetical protein
VFADDGAFAFGSRRSIEEEAWTLYEPRVINYCGGYDAACVRQARLMRRTLGQPVVNLRGFLPDEAIPPNQDGGRRGASR